MRRVTKKLLLFIFGVFFTVFYCEFLIYYVVISQCRWPLVEHSHENEQLKILLIADTHLLGPRRGHWLDKWRREWQMHRAFQTIVTLHNPDAIFVLGDLFDEGEWVNNKQFENYVNRFNRLFSVPNNVNMHVVVGNHDIGFHHYIRRDYARRFFKLLKAPSVQLITLRNNHFVLLNSMAMEGDYCNLCKEARKSIENISATLKCSENPAECPSSQLNYSRPMLMQHFPLYRVSDELCTEPDAPPLPLKTKPFRLKIDALSQEATEYLVSKIKPRVVFGGHTHHGCLLHHSYSVPEKIEFKEYSVPSFSWRNRPDPKYMLATITPNSYAVNKCALPRETTMVITAVILLSVFSYFVLRIKTFGR